MVVKYADGASRQYWYLLEAIEEGHTVVDAIILQTELHIK